MRPQCCLAVVLFALVNGRYRVENATVQYLFDEGGALGNVVRDHGRPDKHGGASNTLIDTAQFLCQLDGPDNEVQGIRTCDECGSGVGPRVYSSGETSVYEFTDASFPGSFSNGTGFTVEMWFRPDDAAPGSSGQLLDVTADTFVSVSPYCSAAAFARSMDLRQDNAQVAFEVTDRKDGTVTCRACVSDVSSQLVPGELYHVVAIVPANGTGYVRALMPNLAFVIRRTLKRKGSTQRA